MATSCEVRYTQTAGSPGNAYGNSPDSDNSVVLLYRDVDSGTAWSTDDSLSAVTFQPNAGLTGSSGVIFSSGQSVTAAWYIEMTCNGCTIRYPKTGTISTTSSCYAGYGYPYCGFLWSIGVSIPISAAAISSGSIALSSGDIKNFLTGVQNYSSVTTKYYFPNNSNYRILSNAHGKFTSWEANIAPTTPTISYPVVNTTTYNTKPRFKMTGTDADGNTLTYQYSIDGSTWTNLATSVTSGTAKTGQIGTAQSTGSKTLHFRTYDGIAYSTTVSIPFTIGATSLSTAVEAKIDDATIDRAQTYITNLAAYYDNTAPSWTAQNAGSKLTQSSINDLNTKLKALTPAQSFTVPTAGSVCSASLFATNIDTAIKNS